MAHLPHHGRPRLRQNPRRCRRRSRPSRRLVGARGGRCDRRPHLRSSPRRMRRRPLRTPPHPRRPHRQMEPQPRPVAPRRRVHHLLRRRRRRRTPHPRLEPEMGVVRRSRPLADHTGTHARQRPDTHTRLGRIHPTRIASAHRPKRSSPAPRKDVADRSSNG